MKYRVEFTVETEAPLEVVQYNFQQGADNSVSHELAGPDDDFYMAAVSDVAVKELP